MGERRAIGIAKKRGIVVKVEKWGHPTAGRRRRDGLSEWKRMC